MLRRVTVLPSLISVNGIAAEGLVLNPILAPPLHAEFVLIQPARRTLSVAARLFLDRFEAQVASIHAVWDRALAAPLARNGRKRRPLRAAARR